MRLPLRGATPLPDPGVVNQDAAHGLGGRSEEVPAAVELLVADEPEVRLVDERSGVEGVAGSFGGYARGGKRPERVVHERQEVVGRRPVVVGRGSIEDAGYIGHAAEFSGNWRQNYRKTRVILHSRHGTDTSISTMSHP